MWRIPKRVMGSPLALRKTGRHLGHLWVSLAQVALERRHGLRPERTDAFFPSFASQFYLEGGLKTQVVDLQVDGLLNTGTGVVEEQKKRVIPQTAPCILIDTVEKSAQLRVLQVLNGLVLPALQGDCAVAFDTAP